MSRCANCGVSGGNGVNLRACAACHLARYCGVKCQKEHWSKHRTDCKKRAAELHDELLFKQPESTHLGDCPICLLPLMIDETKAITMSCCSQMLCQGCFVFNKWREAVERLPMCCPFCRKEEPSEYEGDRRLRERAKKNDPVALCRVGKDYRDYGDYHRAFQYFSKAAEFGNAAAHFELGVLYTNGQGVQWSESKSVFHWEQAAIGGYPRARSELGCIDVVNGRSERAVKHWIIGAKLGCDNSLENLKEAFKHGMVNKNDLATALRAHQAAVDAMTSPQRVQAVEIIKRYN